jgi:hypothetical protein
MPNCRPQPNTPPSTSRWTMTHTHTTFAYYSSKTLEEKHQIWQTFFQHPTIHYMYLILTGKPKRLSCEELSMHSLHVMERCDSRLVFFLFHQYIYGWMDGCVCICAYFILTNTTTTTALIIGSRNNYIATRWIAGTSLGNF